MPGPRRLLTVAVTANVLKLKKNHQLDRLQEVLDFITIMTYDFAGNWDPQTGHHAPLYCNPKSTVPDWCVDATLKYILDAGLNPEKFIVGMPTYGRGWSNVTGAGENGMHAAAGPDNGALAYMSYKEIATQYLTNANGYNHTRYWDAVSQVPYMSNGTHTISYEDEESIALKSKYITEHGFGGAMTWAQSQDNQNKLQQAMFNGVVMVDTDTAEGE